MTTTMTEPRAPTVDAASDEALIERTRLLFERQRAHRWTMAATTADERIARLRRLKDAIALRREELAEAIHVDFGKSPVETEITEIHPVLDEINHAIRSLKRWMKPRSVGTPLLLVGTRSEVRPEPRGVVLILAPWNYPAQLLLAPLVAAVAAGNCAVVRPSEKVPHTAAVLERIVAAAFDPSEVAAVSGGVAVAEALLELPFDHVFFTGSTRIGRRVMEAAARHLATVTLELGGKSPAVVDETADVDAAARAIVWGKFVNAGQTCVAPDYVLVHATRERELLDAMTGVVAEMYGATEEERKASPDFCRVVDDGAFARLSALLDESIRAGARVETGGVTDAAERYVAPTVLSGVGPYSPAMEEEIFGPILPVLRYEREDEVVDLVRRREKPLAMYLFTTRGRNADRLLARTTAGGTVVNGTLVHLVNPSLPFGGVGESGQGSYHGEFGFRAFSHERAVLRQGPRALVHLFHPPYRRVLRELAGAFVRKME